jgi:hypothetical protein
MRGAARRTFQPLVSVVLVYKYIICTARSVGSPPGQGGAEDSLRWFSRGASVGGAKVKLCICAVWGSSGRPEVSVGITTQQGQAVYYYSATSGAVVAVRGGVVGSPLGGEVVCVVGQATNCSRARAAGGSSRAEVRGRRNGARRPQMC